MLKIILQILLINIIITRMVNAQLEISVFTDKENYEYGEKIILSCEITNPADTTFRIFCFIDITHVRQRFIIMILILGNIQNVMKLRRVVNYSNRTSSKIYTWEIDPKIYGLPN